MFQRTKAKVGGWGAGKFNRLTHRGFSEIGARARLARSVMEPTRMSRDDIRSGFRGHYADGGVRRFAEMVRATGLKEADLTRMSRIHAVSAIGYGIAALLTTVALFWFLISSTTASQYIFAMAAILPALVFLLLAIRHDYCQFQIDRRAFAGIKAYFDARRGRDASRSHALQVVETERRDMGRAE